MGNFKLQDIDMVGFFIVFIPMLIFSNKSGDKELMEEKIPNQ